MSKTSKSIEVCNDIKTQIDGYKLLEKEGKLIYDKETPFEDDNPNYKVIRRKLFTVENKIKNLLEVLYYQSVDDNFYFFDCPLSVYKNTYDERLKFYFKYQIDAEEVDFLKEEITNLIEPCYSCRKITIDILTTIDYSRFYPNYSNFRISFEKKKEYLISKVKGLGWDYEELPDEMVKLSRDYYEERPVVGNFKKCRNQNNVDVFDSNSNNNFTFEKDKSLEHNLSKLTIYPTVKYDNGELKRIVVDIKLDQQFIIDISELKSKIEELIFKKTNKLDIESKIVFIKNLLKNLNLKIESLNSQVKLVENNLEKSDTYVIDVLTMSLNLNEEVYKTLSDLLLIENKANIESVEKTKKKQLTSNQIVLFLQEIGFFSHPKIENTTKVKQSKLLSLLTGLNEKNLKTNINKLDKSQLQSSENYQKDIEIVNQYFDDL